MRARVNEKIAKGKYLTILKHSSCEIVGWRLHPADELSDAQPERVLHHLMRVIFLRFPGETWQIHPNLPPGVFPMKPVTRSWTLNDETGATVDRTGFPLVPDYASTGFMIQGTSLNHGLAECGDVLSKPGLNEMLTTYVIFSRLRKAHGLLLLRAFSPFLFRQGCPPGPQCLLKLLRHRFTRSAQTATTHYDHEAAKADYALLAATWEKDRKLSKSLGMQWRCFDCGVQHSSPKFGAKAETAAEIHSACVAPGHWRCCSACLAVQRAAADYSKSEAQNIQCQGACGKEREARYFQEGSEICTSCILKLSDAQYACVVCDRIFPANKLHESQDDTDTYICFNCAPERNMIECTVCSKTQPLTEFEGNYTQLKKQSIRRCNTCRTCVQCHTYHADAKKMAWNSKLCCVCYKANQTKLCDVCKFWLQPNAFPVSQLHHAKDP